MSMSAAEGRKRISRACDSCNALRTKCDGDQPCRHCVETGTPCEFVRARKKRGKAARKNSEKDALLDQDSHQTKADVRLSLLPDPSRTMLPDLRGLQQQPLNYSNHMPQSPTAQNWLNSQPSPVPRSFENAFPSGHGQMPSPMGTPFTSHPPSSTQPPTARFSQNPLSQFPSGPGPHLNHPFNLPIPSPRLLPTNGGDLLHLNGVFATSGVTTPRSHPSPSGYGAYRKPSTSISSEERHQLRYPVLAQHVSELDFIPTPVLCDLLDTYFDNSPYVFGYVIRRSSLLHRFSPRQTSTALIYAILCVAAHTCENAFFSTTPVARAQTVQRLFEKSVTALRPLQHDEIGGGALDDVITYMQLGTIIAASEFKGVSLRWFHSAWTLAKELHLNREYDATESRTMTELTREERRRTWWLLYMIDRHLCLCYNKPLLYTDIESMHLYQPLSEARWNSSEALDMSLDSLSSNSHDQSLANSLYENRHRGPTFTVTGPGIFGFFLPLMVILGEICTLVMMQRSYFLTFDNLDYNKQQIQHHLAQYEDSLERFKTLAVVEQPSMLHNPRRFSENAFFPYAKQLMHTMHILLCGKWDPILLMDDTDGWISSSEFVAAATHAVAAAEATTDILRIDPDLAFMPFFFGIYLLQGSFLLLLIVDKLESAADAAVIQAAETYIRAHEVCIVTLDTQYQRNFRKVMRSTLNSIWQGNQSSVEEKNRRREILALYRWHEDGRGLVI